MSRVIVRVLIAALLVIPTFVGWADEPALAGDSATTDAAAAVSDQGEKPKVEAEIVVTAHRIEIPLQQNPAATTVVGEAELKAMPRSVAADEALKLVPGVKVDNQANQERVHLSIRGQGILTERGVRGVKVLLDGLPLNDPTGFAPDLFDVDWATVDRIEVLRGPASALYGGGASGGILSITTRDDRGPREGDASLDVGSNGFWKTLAEAGGNTGTLGYRVSASRSWGDGWRVHTRFDATNLYSKLRLYDGPGGKVTAIVAGTSYWNENPEGLNVDQVNEDPRQPNPDALTYNEYQDTKRGTTGVVSQFKLADNQDLMLTAYYRHTMWRESVPSAVDHRTYDTPGGLVQYTLRGKLGDLDNELSAGVDLDWQVIDQYKRTNTGGGHEGPDVLADQKIQQSSWGLWALDRLQLARDWNLVLGVRHDDISNELTDNLQVGGVDRSGDASFAKSTARLGVAWEVSPDFGVYASVAQGFLPPATEELANNPVAQGGFNDGLKPATSIGEEVGIRGGLGTTFSYDVALFHLATTDDFGRYRMSERPLETFYRNAGDSTRYGLETSLGWFPVEPVAIRLAYTYSDFTYDTVMYGTDVYRDTDLPNAPKHQAYLDAAWNLGRGLTVGASADSVSSWYLDSTNAVSNDGYTLVNARVGYRFARHSWSGEILLSGRNLTDKTWIAFTEPDPDGNSYQPGPGREGFLGVALTF